MARSARVRRLALLLEYEGTGFGGSQYQNNAETIQGALERAVSSLTGEPTRVAFAGRTDAGVHALGQVAAFNTGSRHGADVFLRALNQRLPEPIAVRAVREVPLTFGPRRQALSRWYRYKVYNHAVRPALLRRVTWRVAEPLVVEAMHRAASTLAGDHDFAAFTLPSVAARMSSRRRVTMAQVTRCGLLVRVDVEGNAFLQQQVRRIVGSLVEVGRGKLSPTGFEQLLREARPGSGRLVAPARGLCLMRVRYEDGLFDDETHENL